MYCLLRCWCRHPSRFSLAFLFAIFVGNLLIALFMSGLHPNHNANSNVSKGDKVLKSESVLPFGELPSLVQDDLIMSRASVTDLTEALVNNEHRNIANPTDTTTDEGNHEPSSTIAALVPCPRLQIAKKVRVADSVTRCKPHTPSRESCNHANAIYVHDTVTHSCKGSAKTVICLYENKNFRCDLTVCKRDPVKLHLMDIQQGEVKVRKERYNKSTELESDVKKYSLRSMKKGYNFVFVSCADDALRTQLIPLVTTEIPLGGKRGLLRSGGINFNFVLLDSVARAHFYRSLKGTIKAFEAVNLDPASDAEVMDFEYFQAIHGHSAANARAFFKGDLFPKSYSDEEMDLDSVGYDSFYQLFKAAGYSTLHQIDLCWTDVWGFMQDLGSSRHWKELHKKISQAHIDDTGLSFASCKMLEAHYLTNPYNTYKDMKLCYNGAAMDTYFLQYSLSRLSNAEASRKPLVSVSMLNVGHDSGGVRIQTIDGDLAEYVKRSSRLENTLTVIFADHGNTYTDYTYEDIEGQFEMYHPSLFMIFPTSVKRKLGKDVMNSMRVNQKRLLTMLDLHQGVEDILHLSTNEQKTGTGRSKGLLGAISAERWCSELPLFMPNLCLCQGWATPARNDTEILGMMEFAVGELNRKIMHEKTADGTVRGCMRLVPTSVDNVMENVGDGRVFVSLDIHTASVTEKHAAFKVEISLVRIASSDTFDMRVENFDRISQYGKFKACRDGSVLLKLCVCDFQKSQVEDIISKDADDRIKYLISHSTSGQVEAFNSLSSESHVTLVESKLYVVVREYKHSRGRIICRTFEVANTSHDIFEVALKFSKMTGSKPVADVKPVISKPTTIIFLASFMRTSPVSSVDFKYHFVHKII